MTTPRKKLLLFTIRHLLIIVAIIVIAIIGIRILSDRIHIAAEDIVTLKKLEQILKIRSDSLAELNNHLDRTGILEKKISDALPPVRDILEFVGTLESLAQKNNILLSVSFGEPSETEFIIGEPRAKIYSIPFTLTLNATVFTFLQYLKDVEDLAYFIAIENIAISATAENGWTNTSNIVINGRLYTRGNN